MSISDREDAVLDKVAAIQRRAADHYDQARLLADQARNEQMLAEDLDEAAETLWKPLITDHPEWRDALIMGKDPRVAG